MQYYGVDGLGSVRQIYDASGQVVGNSRYDPYGNVMSQSGATSVFAFAGEQYDAGTGLEYLRARYYSSAQGRFTTRDVWEGDPNSPMSYNAWLYASGNPLKYTDPTGHCEGDPNDPAGLDAACWKEVRRIEHDFSGVHLDSASWTTVELQTIYKALANFSRSVGGVEAAMKAIGGVTFAVNNGEWLDKDGRPFAGHLNGLIRLPHAHFQQQGFRQLLGPEIGIVHELGHYWDWKYTNYISRLLGLGTISCDIFSLEKGPTQYGRSNLREEWAESVAMWVYPQYSDILRSEGDPLENPLDVATGRPKLAGEGGPGLGPNHTMYLMRQIFMLGGWKW